MLHLFFNVYLQNNRYSTDFTILLHLNQCECSKHQILIIFTNTSLNVLQRFNSWLWRKEAALSGEQRMWYLFSHSNKTKHNPLQSQKSYLLSFSRLNGECFTGITSEEQTIMGLFGSQCLKMVMVMVTVMKLQCILLEKLYVKVYVIVRIQRFLFLHKIHFLSLPFEWKVFGSSEIMLKTTR